MRVCVYIYIYILIIFYHPYIHIIILIIIYHPILATICTLCEAPESNNIDSGRIQINCIIIIIITSQNQQAIATAGPAPVLTPQDVNHS